MPLYEYTCENCDNDFELLIRSAHESPACPTCGTPKIVKRLSVPAAHIGDSGALQVCETPRGAGCGLPQCGSGGCMGMGF